jgi:drug/metabolite transporter (DMT)-like permease
MPPAFRAGFFPLAMRFRGVGQSLTPNVRGMLWICLSGIIFCVLNAATRGIALDLGPFETQFLRYIGTILVMVPFVARVGFAAYSPNGLAGQAWRGIIHTTGLLLWFMALPMIPLADVTAIGFTTPIFVMIGAVLVFREKMVWARWVSAAVGLLGVVVVLAPKMSGDGGFYNLLMLASSPLFACSFLITKALTKRDRPEVIVVWQAISIATFTLPFALWQWHWPSVGQCFWMLGCGVLGTSGQYFMTRGVHVAEVSATQPVTFLNLIWSTVIGYLAFAEVPGVTTIIGGTVIFMATTWIARREARARPRH